VAQGKKGLTAPLGRSCGCRISRPRPVQSSFTAARVPFAMKMSLIPFASVLAVVTVLAAAAPIARSAQVQRTIAVAAASVSMEQAVKMAEQRFKARVVRAETQRNDGRTVYVLRMLNESGRVWTVRVDASNGALL
jgi:Peptidase propeptide and YPEB domain